MDAIRANAARAELDAIGQSLIQRCINLAADLAEANAKLTKKDAELVAAKVEIETLKNAA